MTEDLLPILYGAMGLGLLALYPTWLMYQKAFYTSQGWYRVVTVLFCLLLPPLIAGICYFIPFQLSKAKQMTATEMLTDYVIFGVCPAAVLALAGWVADVIADRDRPRRALMAGAALCAIALLPAAYYLFAEQTFQMFDIQIESAATKL